MMATHAQEVLPDLHRPVGLRRLFFRILAVLVCFPMMTGLKPAVAAECLDTVAPFDCRGCHGDVRVLPRDHEETTTMSGDECRGCHQEGAIRLRTKLPLFHIHRLLGVGCSDCHPSQHPLRPLTTAACLTCHTSYQAVAQRTSNLDPDPHNSPHYGMTQDCDLCHHQHSPSENFCAQCHEWALCVP